MRPPSLQRPGRRQGFPRFPGENRQDPSERKRAPIWSENRHPSTTRADERCGKDSILYVGVVTAQISFQIVDATAATTAAARVNHQKLHKGQGLGALALKDFLKSGGRTAAVGATIDFLGGGGHGRTFTSHKNALKQRHTVTIEGIRCKSPPRSTSKLPRFDGRCWYCLVHDIKYSY